MCKRMKLEYFLTQYTKINSKCIKDLNVRPKTIQLLEENLGRTLSDGNHRKIFYDTSKVMEINTKINEWDWTSKLLHSEVNYKQGEKTTLRKGKIKW